MRAEVIQKIRDEKVVSENGAPTHESTQKEP